MTRKRETFDKVARAVCASNINRPRGGFIPPWEPGKTEKLAKILKPLRLSVEAKNNLIERTRLAVESFYISPGPITPDTRKKLERLEKAAKDVASAWRDIGAEAQQSLLGYVVAVLSKTPRSEDEFLTQRISLFLAGDHVAVASGAAKLREVTSGARAPSEYQFCIHLCIAWRDCTGQEPAASRNKNELTGESITTPFQRFLAASIAPHSISDRVVRDAIEAFRCLGDKE